MIKLLIAFSLIPSLLWAGQGMGPGPGMGGQAYEAFTINGISGVSSDTPVDTGTQSITTGAGFVLVSATCSTAGSFDEAYVRLDVDSSYVQLDCIDGADNSTTLSLPVTAGAHNIRVHGALSGAGSFDGFDFRKPRL